jgi:hypothetical protein
LADGTYTITTRDANSCTTTCVATIQAPPALTCSATPTNAQCNSANGGNGGSISVSANGGTGSRTYSNNGGAFQTSNVFSGLADGTYTITTRDANSCTTTCVATIQAPPALTCSATPTNAQCNSANGGAGGSISVSANGGTGSRTYSRSGTGGGVFQTSNVFNGLADGTYTVTTRDANSCTTTCVATIQAPPALTCSAIPTNAQCNSANGGAGGSISVSANGGTGSRTYSNNGGAFQTSNVFSGLADGTYTITTRDANSCTTTCVATIQAPPALTCSATPTNAQCNSANGGNGGSISVTANGGTGSRTYTQRSAVEYSKLRMYSAD